MTKELKQAVHEEDLHTEAQKALEEPLDPPNTGFTYRNSGAGGFGTGLIGREVTARGRNHTDGPWFLRNRRDRPWVQLGGDDTDENTGDGSCEVYGEHALANALAISATPEALEALEACAAWVKLHAKPGEEPRCLDMARAALVKAGGRVL